MSGIVLSMPFDPSDFSGERIPGRKGLEIPGKLRESDLRPLKGNIFSGIHFMEKRIKLWYMMGRLGVARWIPVMRQLWKKYGR